MPTQTFNFVNQVTFDAGTNTYVITDSNSANNTQPRDVALNVAITDTAGDGTLVAGDALTSGTALDGLTDFTYVGTASVTSGGTTYNGFIIQSGSNYYFVTNDDLPQTLNNNNGSNVVTVNPAGNTPTCFYAGTMIATPDGERAVETLKSGDQVLSADGAALTLNWLGRQTISTVFADPLRVLPVRIKAGALGGGLPKRDLLVSPDHALFLDGILVHAGALVNGVTILREKDVPQTFTYYHIETSSHALVLAEGVAAETFVDNVERLRFDNWDERAALPYGDRIAEMNYPRAKSARQLPAALRQKLDVAAGAVTAAA